MATIQQINPILADFAKSAGERLELRRELKIGSLIGTNPGVAIVRLMFDNGSKYPILESCYFRGDDLLMLRGQFFQSRWRSVAEHVCSGRP